MENDKTQLTWGGRFEESPSDLMLEFSESVSFDKRLAHYDISVGKAHSTMLASVGLISQEEKKSIFSGLDEIASEIKAGKFNWDIKLEDVHMNIEQALTTKTPAAAKLHTARSRNDLVATDMRLYFKDACQGLIDCVVETMHCLLEKADSWKAVYIPGYTHLQRAQPVSAAHHLLAYVEMFSRDIRRLKEVREHANECPLGSGAIAGTTLGIDRLIVAKELGFVDSEGNGIVTQNSMDAVSDRDLYIEFLNACSLCALHISRFSEDVIIWNTAEFSFVKLPDAFTTGSSLMPQKKNPDSLELLRGKVAGIAGSLQNLYMLVKGLPLTYNRDLQDDKPPVFRSHDQLEISLHVLSGTIRGMELNKENCARAVADPVLLATDLADYLVEKDVSFRDAHHIVGSLVAKAEEKNILLNAISDEDALAISDVLSGDWRGVFDISRAMARRENLGMPGPKAIQSRLDYWKNSFLKTFS